MSRKGVSMFAGCNKLTVVVHNITERAFYALNFYVDPILSVGLHKAVHFKPAFLLKL